MVTASSYTRDIVSGAITDSKPERKLHEERMWSEVTADTEEGSCDTIRVTAPQLCN